MPRNGPNPGMGSPLRLRASAFIMRARGWNSGQMVSNQMEPGRMNRTFAVCAPETVATRSARQNSANCSETESPPRVRTATTSLKDASSRKTRSTSAAFCQFRGLSESFPMSVRPYRTATPLRGHSAAEGTGTGAPMATATAERTPCASAAGEKPARRLPGVMNSPYMSLMPACPSTATRPKQATSPGRSHLTSAVGATARRSASRSVQYHRRGALVASSG
mmetsp:Transcript_37089/g.106804  ORF Transcript_37089/g.106804 Transcript_37089/m.106804 type:complete len:221 (+) Transcript_37089:494-1156(+)